MPSMGFAELRDGIEWPMTAMDRYWQDLDSSGRTWHERDTAWKVETAVELLLEHRIRPRSICDVGCGTGAALESLGRSCGSQVLVGYEPSLEALRLVPDSRRSIVRFVNGLATSEPDTFDLMLCFDVLEHVEDPFAFLRSIRDKADMALFNIPLDMNVLNAMRPRALLKIRDAIGHLHYFCAETALATLRDADYEVIATRYAWNPDPTPDGRSVGRQLLRWVRRAAYNLNEPMTARFLGGIALFVLTRPH